jgi:carboxyl-terminal processing protease
VKQIRGGCALVRVAALCSFALCLQVAFQATPAAAQAGGGQCTPLDKNLFVRDAMSDLYLWYPHLPELDPARYDTPEAYLEALRYRPLDASFSYVADRAATEALFTSSEYAGFGFSSTWWPGPIPDLRISQVFPGSPADEAGLMRGDQIAEIAGRTVVELLRTGRFGEAFGPDTSGFQAEFVVVRAGERRRAMLVKRAVVIPTVSHTAVFDVGGRRVGYIFFRNFVEPSFTALGEAFEVLRAGGATEVVLDLRYNGGGLVNVAQYLASMLGGSRTAGQVFAEYFHNDKNAARNRVLRFENRPGAMALNRLVVITTRGSASASELVINALRPFIPVLVVGDRTYGKPVGQYALTFCDKILAPVSFQLRNANGEGDFFDGLPVDCAAPDDVTSPIGDPMEGSLHEAFTVISTGACSAPAAAEEARSRAQRTEQLPRATGWQSVLNAH